MAAGSVTMPTQVKYLGAELSVELDGSAARDGHELAHGRAAPLVPRWGTGHISSNECHSTEVRALIFSDPSHPGSAQLVGLPDSRVSSPASRLPWGRPNPPYRSKLENADRKITVQELVGLAIALGVTPNRLLLTPPAGGDQEEIELTPELRVPTLRAWGWACGESVLEPHDLPEGVPQPYLDEFRAINRPHHPAEISATELERYANLLQSKAADAARIQNVPTRVIAESLRRMAWGFEFLLGGDGDEAVDDLWYLRARDAAGDRLPSKRHGRGKRWRVRYVDDTGAQVTKFFVKKVDAER